MALFDEERLRAWWDVKILTLRSDRIISIAASKFGLSFSFFFFFCECKVHFGMFFDVKLVFPFFLQKKKITANDPRISDRLKGLTLENSKKNKSQAILPGKPIEERAKNRKGQSTQGTTCHFDHRRWRPRRRYRHSYPRRNECLLH